MNLQQWLLDENSLLGSKFMNSGQLHVGIVACRAWAHFLCLPRRQPRFCFQWFAPARFEMYWNYQRRCSRTLQSRFWQVPLRFCAFHPQWWSLYTSGLISIGRITECGDSWQIVAAVVLHVVHTIASAWHQTMLKEEEDEDNFGWELLSSISIRHTFATSWCHRGCCTLSVFGCG